MSRKEALQVQMKAFLPELEKASEIVYQADNESRDMTPEEKAIANPILQRGKELTEAMRQVKSDEAVLAEAKAMSARVGVASSAPPSGGRLDGKRISFKGMGAGAASKMVGEYGQKALAPSGAAVVAQQFAEDPIPLGRIATGLLDVLPVKVQPTAEYAFMRQTTRTNNAAVVADGAVKPTSVLSVTRVEQSLQVVAHLSEGVRRFWLLDSTALEEFVDAELRYGLGVALEAKILSDINGTSGIQAQAYATSVLATVRKGITKLETAGYSLGAIVLHPSDFEGIELALASTSAIEHLSLPFNAASRRLFGVPIASTVSQAAGVGHVLAADAVVVDTDSQGIGVQWSENATADSFAKNLIFARCEGRFNTSVLSPLGVVSCDLTA